MITVKIPEEIRCAQIFEKMEELIEYGIHRFEINIRLSDKQEPILCADADLGRDFEQEIDLIFLEELFRYMSDKQEELGVVLNLQEPNLENLIKEQIEKWDLKSQVKYAGQVAPDHLTPWDRPYIYYNVENCLPNFYEIETIKKTHFDVIHYFCRKLNIKTLRVRAEAVSPDFICWAKDRDLKLSVYEIESVELAEALLKKGVIQATTIDITSVYMNVLSKETNKAFGS